jgi:hypothetical protein
MDVRPRSMQVLSERPRNGQRIYLYDGSQALGVSVSEIWQLVQAGELPRASESGIPEGDRWGKEGRCDTKGRWPHLPCLPTDGIITA